MDLGNGIALNLLPCDKFKTNYLSVEFLCPMSEETAALNALLPFVLKRGTRRLPSLLALTQELEMLYGSHIGARVGKVGDTQFFGFHSAPLRDEYAEGMKVTASVLALIGEMILTPYQEEGQLSASFTEQEKNVLIDAIQSRINNKGHYALLRCREEMCRNDPSALPETGTEEQVAAITAARLTDHLNTVRRAYRMEIWCVGIFDRNELLEQVQSLFRTAIRNPIPLPAHKPFCLNDNPQRVCEEQPVKQGKLCLGFGTEIRSGHPMAPAYTLLLEILGGSPTSKLFVNVREKQSLCYYCSAIPEMQKGILLIASGIEVADRDKAEAAILREVEACRQGEITAEEILAAKKSIENSIRAMYDEPSAMIAWYFKRGLIGSTESPLSYWEKIQAVTAADLAAAAQTLTLDTVYFLNGTLPGEENMDV